MRWTNYLLEDSLWELAVLRSERCLELSSARVTNHGEHYYNPLLHQGMQVLKQ